MKGLRRTILALFFLLAVIGLRLLVVPQVSAQGGSCDGWASEGSEHRNSGNGCVYRCSGGNWDGPKRCDGKGNGQFQGAAAKTAEERRRQEEAVRQRQQEAEKKVQEQGTAATSAIASGTAEQRSKEAARQQSMVEAARQAAVARGVSAVEANRQAQEASQLVSEAQGTQRGAQIVGSGDQRAAEIAAKGYDPNSSLALTGNIEQSTTAVVAAQNTAVNSVNTGGTCDQNTGSTNSVGVGGACCRGGISECNADTNGTCMTDLDRNGTVGYCGQKGQADTAGFCGDSYCQPKERGTPESPNYCAQDCANTNERGDTLFRIEAGKCVACQAGDSGCVTFASCRRGTSTDPSVVSPQVQNAQNRYVEAYRNCFFDEVEFTEGTLNSECIRNLDAARRSLEAVDPTGVTRVQPIIAEERTVYAQTFAASQAQESCRQYQNASDQAECNRAANAQTDQARREREEFCQAYPDRCSAVTNNANGYRADLQDYYQERAQIIQTAQATAQQIQNEARQNCANAANTGECLDAYETRITQAYNQVTLLTGENAPMCATRPDLCSRARQERDAAIAEVNNTFNPDNVTNRAEANTNDSCGGLGQDACGAQDNICDDGFVRLDRGCIVTNSAIDSRDEADFNRFCGGDDQPPCGGERNICDTNMQFRGGLCREQVGTTEATNPILAQANESCGGIGQPACGTTQTVCDSTDLTTDSNRNCVAREADPGQTAPDNVTTYTSPDICEQSGLRGCRYNGRWACVDPNEYPVVASSQDTSRGCQAWQTALQTVPTAPRYGVFDTSGECVGPQDCLCPDGETVPQGSYCDTAVTAAIQGCASTEQTPNPAQNLYCCEGLEQITRTTNGRTETRCQAQIELTVVEQDFNVDPIVCQDSNGCDCQNVDGRSITHVGQGVACPTEDRRSDWPQCASRVVPYDTDYSTACLVGEGWAGQCQTGFEVDGDQCSPRTWSAITFDALCTALPLLPRCPQNPNGEVLDVGESCPEGVRQCFCPTGRLDGTTCRAIEQITPGETCADAAFCQCREGKLVGGRCVPDNDASFCLAFQGGERCTDGYRYRCNISVYPTGRLEWTGETCGERICIPGRSECTGSSNFRICREDGTGWIENNACASGFICVNDERRCFDNRPFTIAENRCTLTEARDYAVNLPQCGSDNYICQYGPARSINGRFICPDPTGSFGHGCPDGMYWEGLANECRYRANAEQGIESYAGYQCTARTGTTTQRNLCQACGRIGQPPCRNCFGDVNTVCSTEPIGAYIIVPSNTTDQEFVNQTFGFACNTSGQCYACGGTTGVNCPVSGMNQDPAHNLITDCSALQNVNRQEALRLCPTSGTGVTGDQRSGSTCQFVSATTGFNPQPAHYECSACYSNPQLGSACPTNQDFFPLNPTDACNAQRTAHPDIECRAL